MNYSQIPEKSNQQFTISNFLSIESKAELIADIYNGLTSTQKCISSRFFYDDNGSSLFEEITLLPEYYLTRKEKSILRADAKKIIGDFDDLDIIELGSGDCSKISILLDVVPIDKLAKVRYIPVDVSESAIFKSADILSLKYPGLKIHGLLADFMKHISFPHEKRRRLICFFGSTLGNLNYKQSLKFLTDLKSRMNKGDDLVIGLDMLKEAHVIETAYNDKQGITALFNKNILNVVNQITGSYFDTIHFEHMAFFNRDKNRIEMHLKALRNMVIKSDFFPGKIRLKKGETIHTENSHKFTSSDVHNLAFVVGLRVEEIYTDILKWFSLVKFTIDHNSKSL